MIRTRLQPGDPGLAAKLRGAVEGEVRFDALTRGIYATDASHYQVEPLGVVVPKSVDDVRAVLEIAREEGAPVLPRGAGTSQCGQTVGRAIVVDTSRHLTTIEPYRGDGHVEVEPGVVLERLNEALRPHGLWFPVDPSTASRATLGGMAGNDSAGARSLRYGTMADNVTAADVLLADGRRVRLGEGSTAERDMPAELAALRALYAREAEEIARRTPATLRNVAGYALERLVPARENLAKLLVGSEGTLAFFTRLRLALRPLPERRALGVCRFPGLLEALGTVQHIVGLGPSAVELVDRTVLGLARSRPAWRAVLDAVVPGEPGAVLLVELAAEPGEPDPAPRLRDLSRLLAELGFPEAVAPVTEPARQAAVWKVREAGLSI
ncbi:MAG TPA: FAD-binding oxidoreductase, partial [Longimicrobiales bacterium]|nr:FAD-binding oxidoreductase [Longimicrobiales bacterium]